MPNIDLILEKASQLWAALSRSCTRFKLPFDQASSLPVLFDNQKSEICLLWGKSNYAALLLCCVLCPELFPVHLLLQQLPDNKYVAYSNFLVQVEKKCITEVSFSDRCCTGCFTHRYDLCAELWGILSFEQCPLRWRADSVEWDCQTSHHKDMASKTLCGECCSLINMRGFSSV